MDKRLLVKHNLLDYLINKDYILNLNRYKNNIF